jgi:hypothetical protein
MSLLSTENFFSENCKQVEVNSGTKHEEKYKAAVKISQNVSTFK